MRNGEGRRAVGKKPTHAPAASAGVVGTACWQGMLRNVGEPRSGRSRALQPCRKHGLSGKSDGLIVVKKLRNGSGAKEPDFGVLPRESKARGLA